MERKKISLEQKLAQSIVILSLALSGCTATPTPPLPTETQPKPALTETIPPKEKEKPQPVIIICAVPDKSPLKSSFPHAIMFVSIKREGGDLKINSQAFSGSEMFKTNPDGSLNPVMSGDSTMIRPGFDFQIEIHNPGILKEPFPINIGNCLVDESQLKNLRNIINPPDHQINIQGLKLTPPLRPEKNPFRGNFSLTRQIRASKPQGFHHF